MSSLLYAVAAGAFVVFLFVCAATELARRGPRRLILLPVLLSVAVPLLEGRYLFGLGQAEVWPTLLPVPWSKMALRDRGALVVCALYLLIVVLGVVCLLWRLAARRRSTSTTAPGPIRTAPVSTRKEHHRRSGADRSAEAQNWSISGVPRILLGGPAAISWLISTASLLLLAYGSVYACHDRTLETRLRIDYLAWTQQWLELSGLGLSGPPGKSAQCAIAQAAYHNGTLTRELPEVQTPEDLVLFNELDSAHWRKANLYLDLGYVLMTLHYATEAIELYGERPLLLRQLAMMNLALGNVTTAKIYLHSLEKVPFHSGWARDYLNRVNADPELTSDVEVSRLRSLMPKKDYVLRLPVEQSLLLLLDANRQNRMAFEYLMTYYLLAKNLPGFVKHLPLADHLDVFKVPRLWEEAIVLAAQTMGEQANLKNHPLDAAAQRQLEAMLQSLAKYQGDQQLARRKLQQDYGQSYFYYYYLHP